MLDEFHFEEGHISLLGRTGLYFKTHTGEYHIDPEMGLGEPPNLALYKDSVRRRDKEDDSAIPAATRHLIATQVKEVLVKAGLVVYFF